MSDSSKIVIQSPMSFVGAYHRTRNLMSPSPWLWAAGSFLLILWWTLIVSWYCMFGLLVVPWRLIRRGGRKRKLADARHSEMLEALNRR